MLNKKILQKPKLIKTKPHFDYRGCLIETLPKKIFFKIKFSLVTTSKKNVFRGLHYQKLYAQAKLIFLIKGKIVDYCLDLRKNSKSYGKLYKFNLKKNNLLFIPKGFAHGYKTLDKENTLIYFMDNIRHAKHERGILHKDIKLTGIITSNKDKNLQIFKI